MQRSPGCSPRSPSSTARGWTYRAGHAADRELLLGPERPHARLHASACCPRRSPSNYPNDGPGRFSYAGTLHYLKTVADLGVAAAKADGRATVARMKAMKFDDDAFGTGTIREDGRVMVTAYLFQVKTPEESSGEWDLYKLLATVPPEQAFRPLTEGKCGFVKA